MEFSHILVSHEYEAEDILKKLKSGEDFSDLAKKFSICSSSKNGGYLGHIKKGQTVVDFEEAAFGLKQDIYSNPVRTSFGYHIIYRHS